MTAASRLVFAGLVATVVAGACRAADHGPRLQLPDTGTIVVLDRPPTDDVLHGRQIVPALVTTDVPPFDVLARESELARAPCANCHTVPIATLQARRPASEPRAHWTVSLVHAADTVMTCATCHASSDPGALRLLEGEPVGFDHAYAVCAQCHSPQRRDWEGGAHGKRVGGWTSPRVVYNCTECHDPHQPAFGTRWPARSGRAR
jgi:hypothetical protein